MADPEIRARQRWRQAQASASRSVHITIANETDFELRRTAQEIPHGTWSCLPPDRIPPRTVVECGIHSTAFRTGTDAAMTYALYGTNEAANELRFVVDNPLLGSAKYNLDHASSFLVARQRMAATGKHAEVVWTLVPSGDVPSTPMRHTGRAEARASARRARDDLVNRLKSARRSVVAVIVNESEATLTRLDSELPYGAWVAPPPEEIEPGAMVCFGAKNSKYLAGTEGTVTYVTDASDYPVRFSFDNPIVGNNSFESSAAEPLAVSFEDENGNNAVVVFTVRQVAAVTGGGAGVGGGSAGRGQDVTSKTSTSYVPGKYTKKFFNSIVAGVAGSPVGGSSSASGSAANDDDAVRTREESRLMENPYLAINPHGAPEAVRRGYTLDELFGDDE